MFAQRSSRRMLVLEYERRNRGLNQTDTALLGHITQQEISLIEQGRLLPTRAQLERLAQVFDVTPPDRLLQPVESFREARS